MLHISLKILRWDILHVLILVNLDTSETQLLEFVNYVIRIVHNALKIALIVRLALLATAGTTSIAFFPVKWVILIRRLILLWTALSATLLVQSVSTLLYAQFALSITQIRAFFSILFAIPNFNVQLATSETLTMELGLTFVSLVQTYVLLVQEFPLLVSPV